MRILNRFRRRSRADGPRLRIFAFHAIVRDRMPISDSCFLDAALFQQHLDIIQDLYEVLPLSEAVDKLRSGRIERPTAVLTFDDGFQNNFDIAFPILEQRRLAATVFVVTGLVGTNKTLWYCRLHRALARTHESVLNWRGETLPLDGPSARSRTNLTLQRDLKGLPSGELEKTVDRLVRRLGCPPDELVQENEPYRILSPDALTTMASSGLITFGAHTHSHPSLRMLSPQEQRREIRRSVTALDDLLGHPPGLFAYPYGGADDYDEKTFTILRSEGVEIALTSRPGPNTPETSPLELRRVTLDPKDDVQLIERELKLMIQRDFPAGVPAQRVRNCRRHS